MVLFQNPKSIADEMGDQMIPANICEEWPKTSTCSPGLKYPVLHTSVPSLGKNISLIVLEI